LNIHAWQNETEPKKGVKALKSVKSRKLSRTIAQSHVSQALRSQNGCISYSSKIRLTAWVGLVVPPNTPLQL